MADSGISNSHPKLVLGIDIGTTSVKVVVVSRSSREIVAKQSKETQANVPSDLGIEGHKQHVPKILSALHSCVSRLPKDLLRQIDGIGICGQMHGVTLWNSEELENPARNPLDVPKDKVSHLYTWQDGRCDPVFLGTLPVPSNQLKVHSGFGCATLFWFARNKPEKLRKYSRSGTIQDLVVFLLTGRSEVAISTQNAASWGFFLEDDAAWDRATLSTAGFPLELLPKEILRPGEVAGRLRSPWFGIPAGTPIGVALGDLQCSVYALSRNKDEAVLNISTSAQLAYVHPIGAPKTSVSDKIEFWPYFGNNELAVAASLNGGNFLATFVKTLQEWTLELGCPVPQSKVWDKLIQLGSAASTDTGMKVTPTLLGERVAPDSTASVNGITLDSLHLGTVFRALCSGVIRNLHDMMSQEVLRSAGISRIIGNGSALVRNLVLQEEVKNWYQLPLEVGHTGDAAFGAALAVIDHP